MTVAFKSAIDDAVIDELRAIIGDDDRVLPNLCSRVNRTRVPAPFPVHRWAEHMPDVAVLPRTAQEVSEVVKLANRLRIPVVPRAGGTGLSDGAVPLRGGILVDVKLMNQIHEIDLVDRTVTVGPGINMLKLNEELQAARRLLSRRPGVVPVLAGRRADRHRRLVAAGRALRPHARPRDLDGGRAADGRDRRDRRGRRAQAAQVLDRRSTLKQLFTGHQGTLGICTEATLELVPRPEIEFAAFFAFDDYMKAWETTGVLTKSGLATLAGVVLFDEWKIAYLRRDDEAYIPQPESVQGGRGGGDVRPPRARSSRRRRWSCSSAAASAASTSATRSPPATGPRATTATRPRCTAARKDGQAVMMSWHCEDAALNYSVLPQVREEWHAIVARYRERYGIFDDWGMFAYTSGAHKPWARLPGGDRRRHLGAAARRRDLGRLGATASARSPR